MPAYMQIKGVDGEALEKDHKDWILIESLNAPIHRQIPGNALGHERTHGTTVLGDIVITRVLDKSSVKLAEKCAKGEMLPEVKIDMCTRVDGKDLSYITYTLKNVIITGYNVSAHKDGGIKPTEEVLMNYTDIKWEYTARDPEKGAKQGQVVAEFNPSKN